MPNLSPSCPLLARAHFTYAHAMASLYHTCLAPVTRAVTNATHEHDAARVSNPLHRASPRATPSAAPLPPSRAVMQRTSGLLHHALLAPLHCSRPCRARHSRAPLLASPPPLPSRRAPLLVSPLPLPSRSTACAAAAATVLIITQCNGPVIRCIVPLTRAVVAPLSPHKL